MLYSFYFLVIISPYNAGQKPQGRKPCALLDKAHGPAATGTRQGYRQHIGKGKTLQRKGNAKQVLQKG